MRPSVLAAAVALVCAVAGGVIAMVSASKPTALRRAAAASALPAEDLENRLKQLEHEIVELKMTRSPGGPSPQRTEVDRAEVSTSASSAPVSEPENPEEQEQRVQERFQKLDTVFRAEARDPSWARGMESLLIASAQNPGLENLVITNASCATTLCKVEATAREPGAQAPVDAFIDKVAQEDIGSGTVRRLGEPVGNRVVAYFSRKGHALPP